MPSFSRPSATEGGGGRNFFFIGYGLRPPAAPLDPRLLPTNYQVYWAILDACEWSLMHVLLAKTKGRQICKNYDNSVITGLITLNLRIGMQAFTWQRISMCHTWGATACAHLQGNGRSRSRVRLNRPRSNLVGILKSIWTHCVRAHVQGDGSSLQISRTTGPIALKFGT